MLMMSSLVLNTEAEGFYDVYGSLFTKDEGYKDAVDQLVTCKCVRDVLNHSYFKKFWKMKYIFNVSTDVLHSLKSFLERAESSLLSNILRFHFHFEALDLAILNFADIKHFEHRSVTDKEKCHTQEDTNLSSGSVIDGSIIDVSVWKSQISNVYIRKFLLECPFSCLCMDINDDETEVCIAHSCPFISVANLPPNENISEPQKEVIMDDNCLTRNPLRRISFSKHVNVVKYIPGVLDAVLVASGTEVKLLNILTAEVLSTFESTHLDTITDIDINSSATFFATASKDRTVCLYNFHKTEVIKKYSGHFDCVNVVRFHPNGIYFATGASDCSVKIWDLENNYNLRTFVHKFAVHLVAFSPDGKMLASADLFGFIRIWNIDDKLIAEISCCDTFDVNLAKVTSVCFNHNSSMLGACNLKGILRLYKVCARERSVSPHGTLFSQNIPLLLRCNKNGDWTLVLRKQHIQ